MKRCPECRRDYYDETLLYCLDDGAALLDGPGSMDEPATAVLHDTAPTSEAKTRAQLHTTASGSSAGDVAAVNGGVKRGLKPLALIAGVALVLASGFLAYWRRRETTRSAES